MKCSCCHWFMIAVSLMQTIVSCSSPMVMRQYGQSEKGLQRRLTCSQIGTSIQKSEKTEFMGCIHTYIFITGVLLLPVINLQVWISWTSAPIGVSYKTGISGIICRCGSCPPPPSFPSSRSSVSRSRVMMQDSIHGRLPTLWHRLDHCFPNSPTLAIPPAMQKQHVVPSDDIIARFLNLETSSTASNCDKRVRMGRRAPLSLPFLHAATLSAAPSLLLLSEVAPSPCHGCRQPIIPWQVPHYDWGIVMYTLGTTGLGRKTLTKVV